MALREAWERARAGAAGVVTLEGAAGSGQDAAAQRASARSSRQAGATVLAGRCREDGRRRRTRRSPRRCASTWKPRRTRSRTGWRASSRGCSPSSRPTRPGPPAARQDARHRLLEAVAATIGAGGPARTRAPGRRGPPLGRPRHAPDARARDLDGRLGAVARRGLDPARRTRGPRSPSSSPSSRRARRLTRVPLGGLPEAEIGGARGRLARRAAGARARSPPSCTRGPAATRCSSRSWSASLRRDAPGETGAALVAAARTGVPARRAGGDRPAASRGCPSSPCGRCGWRRSPARTSRWPTSPQPARRATSGSRRRSTPRSRRGWSTRRGAPGRFRFAHALVREAVLAGVGATRRALAAPAHGRRARAATSGAAPRAGPAPARRAAARRARRGGPLGAPRGARARSRQLAYEDAAAAARARCRRRARGATRAPRRDLPRARRRPVARRRRPGGRGACFAGCHRDRPHRRRRRAAGARRARRRRADREHRPGARRRPRAARGGARRRRRRLRRSVPPLLARLVDRALLRAAARRCARS